jgi:hypothetical protein
MKAMRETCGSLSSFQLNDASALANIGQITQITFSYPLNGGEPESAQDRCPSKACQSSHVPEQFILVVVLVLHSTAIAEHGSRPVSLY